MIDMDRMIDMELNLQAPVPGAPPGKLELQGLAAVRDLSAQLAGQAERSLLIFSRTLDQRVYDQQPFLHALHRLALHGPRSQVRILLVDNHRLVKYNHRLLELARRLTSRIELRRPIAQYAEHGDEYLLADHRGYLYREHADEYEGSAEFYAPLEARRLEERFQAAWEHSQPDPELRRLYL
jgi:hypothetical protein